MSELIINGVSLTEITKMRQAIAKDASALMAVRIEEIKSLISTILATNDKEVAEANAIKAKELLCEVTSIHNASGIEYDMPYSYDGYGDGNASKISDKMGEFDLNWESNSPLNQLQESLEDMESNVEKWNRSYC